MAVSRLCYHNTSCACTAHLGRRGVCAVSVLPAMPVPGREGEEHLGEGVGCLRQEQVTVNISRLSGKQSRAWWRGMSQGTLCPVFARGLESPWLV